MFRARPLLFGWMLRKKISAEKCLPQTPYVLTASLSALGTVLDITTDLMSDYAFEIPFPQFLGSLKF